MHTFFQNAFTRMPLVEHLEMHQFSNRDAAVPDLSRHRDTLKHLGVSGHTLRFDGGKEAFFEFSALEVWEL